ncbi:tyrosine-type recombinase/integrase [Staphylococcus pseudintermedius]|uniref:tyrosine-type recombinase/integrase n=1 Tax=Staphylococcus pseudintermedius TaxID=283734 RepID=UPI0018EF3E6F|nr:tyrosine-type recombinase/integrase [Staphylococcus pseudintermedius]QQJ46455.1 tyrosine-type recombinase/integrase [Staphylococcus pseudintermedius]QQJ48594.1 tyrosine-type recombinase/integrase [Staphylococcus pseudintermedius]QQJ50756.1 tyrosine-type recombinase/integrase [Staphylococcus pseudintermedius]QQJ56325.1 tyrosine-type recombinase/integrase [Staphylococcus pseudintermedius]QQJ57270.1 tyrosine-type recombinase/integrase [Staphylococcus pseudintermedius]
MNCVDPIREMRDIHRMYDFLQSHSIRDYLFFKFAIHTGVKLVGLLNLKVNQVMHDDGTIIEKWDVSQSQEVSVRIPNSLREELKAYIDAEALIKTDLLFRSKRTQKGLSRQQAYRIINTAAQQLGLEHIGLTTLRKTFAYHAFESGISISMIQKYLGHQTSHETMKFIGVPKKEMDTTIALNL